MAGSTIKSMLEEGWKKRTLAGVKCLVLDESRDHGYYLIAPASKAYDGYFSPEEIMKVTDKFLPHTRPEMIHEINGRATTLEYSSRKLECHSAFRKKRMGPFGRMIPIEEVA
jgi:hypothetical protein